MEAKTRRGKRSRPSADTAQAAASASLEESANALANVEGAMSGSSATPSNKRDKAASELSKTITNKERSESIDQLISVAGSLLRDSTATAAAIAESNSASQAAVAAATAATTLPSVPNPIDSRQEPSQGIVKSEQPPQPLQLPPVATSTATSSSQPPKKRQRESKKNKQSETAAKATATTNNNNNAASSDSDTAKKTQIQYNPDVPMTKEQLTAWRREMRRVRNRESAAASRRKVRDRIEELEEEVEVWKKRYEEVMRRLRGGDNDDDDDTNIIGGIRGNNDDGLGDVDGGEGKSEEV